MRRPKVIATLILAVVGIVIILQNTETVETRLLFMTVSMPRAVLLIVTTLVGFSLGVLACLLGGRRRPARPEQE